MQPKKVLIITYAFPPRPISGSVRPMGLAKYLPKFGWEPIVITPKLSGKPPDGIRMIETEYRDILASIKSRFGFDSRKSLHEQIGISVTKNFNYPTFKSKIIKLLKESIAFPDDKIGWQKFAIESGSEFLSKEKADVIISTSPPPTAHLIANRLKQRYKIPWIADFRDLWTQSHYYSYGRMRHFIERKLELRTLGQTDAIVTAHPLVDQLRELHKAKPIYWIPNGFNPDDYPKLSLPETNDKLIMTYTGILYQGKRDPKPLFHALSELIASGEIKQTEVEVRFIGPFDNWLLEDARRYNLHDVVKIEDQVSREEVLRRQIASNLLLILTWDNPHEASIYPGKIFEYLGAQRPILAVGGHGGVVKELLEKTQAGIHVSSLSELRKVLLEYYRAYKTYGTIPYNAVKEEVDKYTHQAMAQRFAEVLDKITIPTN